MRPCRRLRGLEPLTNQLDGLGQRAWTEAEGALDQACLANDVARGVEDRRLTLVERTHHVGVDDLRLFPILQPPESLGKKTLRRRRVPRRREIEIDRGAQLVDRSV